MSKNKKNKYDLHKGDIQTVVAQYFKDHNTRSFTEQQIIKKFAGSFQRFEIMHTLQNLKDKGLLHISPDSRYKYHTGKRIVAGTESTGIIEITKSGSGFVTVEGAGRDIFIAQQNTRDALDGDTITFRKTSMGNRGGRIEGVVTGIVKRKREQFIGVLEKAGNQYRVVPDNKKIHVQFYVSPDNITSGKDGDKVLVRLTDWPHRALNPNGVITEVLKGKDPSDLEMQAILLDNGFFTSFPDEVISEAENIPLIIDPEEIARRRDFRDICTFTIDPDDAKDFDDAISVRNAGNNLWEIGVHIADVSHYVQEDTLLEKEAIKRATSVYLVDRVAPMFPEYLSNILCSLRPNEEKLCFSAVFILDDKARLVDRWFGKTVIYSDKRFSYEEAQKILEGGEGPHKEELLLINKLSKLLRAERFRNGSVNFDTVETKFKLDEDGKPIGVYVKERKDSNLLIEDFMLLANRQVAHYCGKEMNPSGKIPFVYRIHDLPDLEKLKDFNLFSTHFGYKLILDTPAQIASSMNKMMDEIKGKPEQHILENLAIRSMAKAIYTTDNIGHFGLGFDYYTHFTSPIRRYPDVMVHRFMHAILNNTTSNMPGRAVIEARCKHSSEREKAAMEAERASTKYKMAEYMYDRVGQSFDGVVSGVKSWGFFVEIPAYNCEGLVPMDSLSDDVYLYDERKMLIKGMHSHRVLQFGDQVKVRLEYVNMEKKTIDFRLINGAE